MNNTPSLPLNVGLVGAGCMGKGIAFQIQSTPGMNLLWIADQNSASSQTLSTRIPGSAHGHDVHQLLTDHPIDVFVEATNSIGPAAEYSLAALESGAHVVLMNAEVDLALAPLLNAEAALRNLTVTSDAGDQHGVLASLITEADLMGFDIVQAGNIKGFLDRDATPESVKPEAEKRNLSPEQCCAYTDGTKLHIEMAVLANALGYLPPDGGMTGPRAARVEEALTLFDFASYAGTPRIEYLLGAEPGGGVYLIVSPKKDLPPEQEFYLNYYKLSNSPCGTYWLLYRPYHLCHLETPKAIFAAARREPILSTKSKLCDVYAYAKRDLPAGSPIAHAIGSAECYGLVEPLNPSRVPIALLEDESILLKDVAKDTPITFEHLTLPDCPLTQLSHKQSQPAPCQSHSPS